MRSIIQPDDTSCFLCGRNKNFEPLDWHHVYGGALRPLSEKYGLKIRLHHHSCHQFGEQSVHQCRSTREKIQSEVQKKAMEHYGWTVDEWIRIFGRSFL